MRILYINHEKNLGGAAKCLLSIIDNTRINNDIYVLTPFKKGLFVDECNKRNIKVFATKFFNPVTNPKISNTLNYILCYFYNYLISICISLIVKRLHIELIHTNSSIVNIGNYISKFSKIKQIVHFREYVEEDFGWKFIPNRNTVINQIQKNSIAQIFISKTLFSKYEKIFKETGYLIYDGISYSKRNDTYKKNKNSFCIVGRIIEGKRQIDLVEAFNILVNKYGYIDFKLEIIGGGNQEYINKIKKKISAYKLEKNVKLVGYIKDIMEYRSKFEYEISCSQSEGFGRNIIEGMLVQNIIIASNAGAFPELIKDKYDGFLYDVKEVNSLVKIIRECTTGKYDLEYIKTNALNKALNDFSDETNINNILNLYSEVS